MAEYRNILRIGAERAAELRKAVSIASERRRLREARRLVSGAMAKSARAMTCEAFAELVQRIEEDIAVHNWRSVRQRLAEIGRAGDAEVRDVQDDDDDAALREFLETDER